MQNKSLRLSGIVNDSITDGPGLRTAVFTQGCPHKCKNCHNPQTHDFIGGEEFTVTQVFEKIASNPIATGVTFSGGEPLMQPQSLLELAKLVKGLGLEIAVYTGYTFEEAVKDPLKRQLLEECDTLVDGLFLEQQKSLTLKFRGSTNQRVIDLKKSFETGQTVLDQTDRWN